MLADKLKEMLFGEFERVGFILKDGDKIVEVKNVCEDPRNGFAVSAEDLVEFMPISHSTWHTHPNASKVLSPEDYHGFKNYPDHAHYIIGTDGVEKYVVEDGEVVISE